MTRCLRSLLGQRTALSVEIIFVLNNSPDRSPEIAAEIARTSDGKIRVVSEKRRGVACARNRGVEEARAPIILFTDTDCTASPTWVDTLCHALRDPATLVAGGTLLGDPTQTALVARYSCYRQIMSHVPCMNHPVGPFLQTANLAVRRDDALAIGGFDATLAAGEDADFCWRLQRAHPKKRIVVVDGAEVTHTHRETVKALFRQYAVYGWADAALAQRYGVPLRWGFSAVLRAGRECLRFVAAPLLLLFGAVIALWKRDPLPAVIPILPLVSTLGRKVGQLDALRGRWPIYEPALRAERGRQR